MVFTKWIFREAFLQSSWILECWSRGLAGFALAISALALTMPLASAQSTRPTSVNLIAKQNDWTKVCGRDSTQNKNVCYTTRDFGDNKQTDPIVAISAYDFDDGNYTLRMVLPIGIRIPPGAVVGVEGTTLKMDFLNCFKKGCLAEAKTDADFFSKLKRDGTMSILIKNSLNAEVTFTVQLAGFAKASAGRPIDPKVLAQEQNKLQADLQAKNLTQSTKAPSAPIVTPTVAQPNSVIVNSASASTVNCSFGKRVALVVGNAAYPTGSLVNPTNDADDVTAILRDRLCFKVIPVKDATYAVFSQKIGEFAESADGADIALFYYAGHGMQFQQTNLLMPVDAKMGNEYEALHGNISAQDVVTLLESRSKATLVFLDACRDNPLEEDFRKRMKVAQRSYGETRGLAPMAKLGAETLVVFATRPNDRADDGQGRNSPFTSAFLQYIATPNKDIEMVMRDVTALVRQTTNGRQVPQRLTELEHGLMLLPSP